MNTNVGKLVSRWKELLDAFETLPCLRFNCSVFPWISDIWDGKTCRLGQLIMQSLALVVKIAVVNFLSEIRVLVPFSRISQVHDGPKIRAAISTPSMK